MLNAVNVARFLGRPLAVLTSRMATTMLQHLQGSSTHSCSLAVQMSELTARTEADPWDVQAWDGLYRETTAAAAKVPPSDAAAQEISILEQLLKQFPSAVQLPCPPVCMRSSALRMHSHITSQAPHDEACLGQEWVLQWMQGSEESMSVC